MMRVTLAGLLFVSLIALPGVQANEQSCAVDVGFPLIGAQAAGLTFGGCVIGTTNAASVVASVVVSDSEFCFIEADTDGVVGTDVPVEEGTELPSGAVVWLFCDLGVDNYGTVALASGSWA